MMRSIRNNILAVVLFGLIAYGQTNNPPPLPAPQAEETVTFDRYMVITKVSANNYIALEVVGEVTNTVERQVNEYPKQLYIQPMTKTTMFGEWEPITNCRPIIIQIGFLETNQFYSAKLEIK